MTLARDKVCFLIHDLRWLGGAERTFVTYINNATRLEPVAVLVRPQLDMGHELRRPVPLFSLEDPTDVASGGLLNRARHALVSLAPASLVRKAHRLTVVARDSGAGMVSTFLHKSHVIALFAKLFLQPSLRVVINVHETDQQLVHWHTPADRRLLRWVARHWFPKADLIVAVAEGVKRDLIERFDVPADRITVVHNPIDLHGIKTRACDNVTPPAGWRRDGPIVVAVGRLVRLKGFDLLLQAFATLPDSIGARLLIVGDGEERAALSRAIEQLRLSERVAMVGWQTNPWQYMARAQALVVPSLTEVFPNVIGEALALGLPVLATDCSAGVREYLEDGSCGLLVPAGDVAALARGLERLLTDAELRQRLASRGLQRVRAFDLTDNIQAYEAALAGVA